MKKTILSFALVCGGMIFSLATAHAKPKPPPCDAVAKIYNDSGTAKCVPIKDPVPYGAGAYDCGSFVLFQGGPSPQTQQCYSGPDWA